MAWHGMAWHGTAWPKANVLEANAASGAATTDPVDMCRGDAPAFGYDVTTTNRPFRKFARTTGFK
ncbi:hypothetical protein E4U54_007563 [Claviceps lovelessii]|nr:hypothetical protein E4U54_007563 [Claviceps lovelessii]